MMNQGKPLAILINGYNLLDGCQSTISTMSSFFAAQGVPSIMMSYIHMGLMPSRFEKKNEEMAMRLVEIVRNAKGPVICMGHSNGCKIIQMASQQIAIDKAVFINPAMEVDVDLSRFGHVDVYYSPSDEKPTFLHKLLTSMKLTKLLSSVEASKFRPWGEMGMKGAMPANNVTNFDKENDYSVISKKHNDVFTPEMMAFYGPFIVSQAMKQYDDSI